MKVSHVFQDKQPFGDLLADTHLTTVSLLGAVSPDASFPASPATIRVFSDKFDLLFPNELAEAVIDCCVRFGWAAEQDFIAYVDAETEISSMRPDVAAAIIRAPCEVWREHAPHAERWMTLQRATLNYAASLELLQIASTTFHFETQQAEELGRYWRWIAHSGGFQLAIVRQWESPYSAQVELD